MRNPPTPPDQLGRLVRVCFSIVVFTAGASGAALVIAPGSTERYFSWTLRPPAAAALILAATFGAVAVLVWVDATRDDVTRAAPVDLVRLTGAYLGAWCSFLAVLCGWAATRSAWDDARVPLITVAAACGGALVAFLRSLGDLGHPLASLLASSGVLVAAVVMYVRNRPSPPVGSRS